MNNPWNSKAASTKQDATTQAPEMETPEEEDEEQEIDTLSEYVHAAHNLQSIDKTACDSAYILAAEELVLEKARALNV